MFLAALLLLNSCTEAATCRSERSCENEGGMGGLGGDMHSGGRASAGSAQVHTGGQAGAPTGGAANPPESPTGGKPSHSTGGASGGSNGVVGPTCEPGYAQREQECVDIDECEDQPCTANALCSNSPGGFSCSCAPGFYEAEGGCWPDMMLISASGENSGTRGAIEAPSLSADGGSVVLSALASSFGLDTDESPDILYRQVRGGQLQIQSRPPGAASSAVLSADGTALAFSRRSDSGADIFIKHLSQPSPVLISVDSTGASVGGLSNDPSISADGRRVAFYTSFDGVFVRDLTAQTTTHVSENPDQNPNCACGEAHLSGDGSLVAYTCMNLNPGGPCGAFANDLDADERYVLCDEDTLDLCNVSGVSHDGRYVVFSTTASTLTPGDTNDKSDVFLRDLLKETTLRVSVGTAGTQADGDSSGSGVSSDGRYVLFNSRATNLVSGDTNGKQDVFLRDLKEGTTRRVSEGPGDQQSDQDSQAGPAALSADGEFAVFLSSATNFGVETYGVAQVWYKRILP